MAPADRYYEQANPDLLMRIPVTAKAVLEVGCGTGALGQAYKQINPAVTYIGVELMAGPAAEAKEVLNYVIEGDISRQALTELPGGINKVDCIVFGDVLEHLVDPGDVIKALLPFLNDNGMLLACIPNVQHWSVLANLLSGQWPQEDQGLFDRTHLRWFTKASIISLLEDAGLKVQGITPRIFAPEKAQKFVQALQPALTNLNLDPQPFLEGAAPLQYVVQATKTDVQALQISGLMLKPQAGMNDVRMIQPLRSVASLPGVSVQLASDRLKLLPAESQTPRILIWQRQLLTYAKSLDQLREALSWGYVLVSEFDDDPDHWPAIAANKNLNFTAMHAVQTSTDPLAAQLGAINPEVSVFENCLEQLPEIPKHKWQDAGRDKPLRLFFGALNRKESWVEWIDTLNQVLEADQEKWEVDVIHDREFFDALHTTRKRFTPTCDYENYLDRLRHCHIALLPLKATAFNSKKSDLKFVEAAGCGVATIASPTVYDQTIQTNTTGMICGDGHELRSILNHFSHHPDLAKKIAANSRAWCQANRLQCAQSERRLQWYQSLWYRRDELTQSLLQRVPELTP